jgi:hypothetical protein
VTSDRYEDEEVCAGIGEAGRGSSCPDSESEPF